MRHADSELLNTDLQLLPLLMAIQLPSDVSTSRHLVLEMDNLSLYCANMRLITWPQQANRRYLILFNTKAYHLFSPLSPHTRRLNLDNVCLSRLQSARRSVTIIRRNDS